MGYFDQKKLPKTLKSRQNGDKSPKLDSVQRLREHKLPLASTCILCLHPIPVMCVNSK